LDRKLTNRNDGGKIKNKAGIAAQAHELLAGNDNADNNGEAAKNKEKSINDGGKEIVSESLNLTRRAFVKTAFGLGASLFSLPFSGNAAESETDEMIVNIKGLDTELL